MDPILKIGLTNAILATALAVVVAGVTRLLRRPALVHSLWLLVLVKLVTPPFVSIPIPGIALQTDAAASNARKTGAPQPDTDSAPSMPVSDASQKRSDREVTADPSPDTMPQTDERALLVPEASDAPPVTSNVEETDPPPNASLLHPESTGAGEWAVWLLIAWASGSCVCVALAIARALHFRGLLRYARPAPRELQSHPKPLARQPGLSHCPALRLLPGRVSPMLWSLAGKSLLLIPARLWERLAPDQRDSLLLHELAHLRRRDHFVRLFEMVVTALYWWHPVVWWARSELRRAEEDCCDAWVVWTLPGHARAYATALVETLDFLSETPAVLPVGASGIGHIRDLRRRVTMIMLGKTPRSLTWAGVAIVLGLAAMLLPVIPTLAQAPKDDPNPRFKDTKKFEDEQRVADQAEEIARAKADLERAFADLKKAQAELEARQAQLKKAEAELARAKDELKAKQPGGDTRDGPRRIVIIIEGPDGKMSEIKLPPDNELRAVIEKWLMRDEKGPRFEHKPYGEGGSDKLPSLPKDPKGADRLQDLEHRLEQLMKEMEELRRHMPRPDDKKPELPRKEDKTPR